MGIVNKTKQAEQDLLDMWLFIARENETAADKLYGCIEEQCDLYADNPNMGTARPDLYENLRCFFVPPYIAFYLPSSDGIELVRVIHGSRDIQNIFEL